MNEKILNLELESIERYFNSLSNFGYRNYPDVFRIILVSAIEEILTSDFSMFVDEEDYRTIVNVLYCVLGNNCLYDLPSYSTWDSVHHKTNVAHVHRYSEDNTPRITEKGTNRIKA